MILAQKNKKTKRNVQEGSQKLEEKRGKKEKKDTYRLKMGRRK